MLGVMDAGLEPRPPLTEVFIGCQIVCKRDCCGLRAFHFGSIETACEAFVCAHEVGTVLDAVDQLDSLTARTERLDRANWSPWASARRKKGATVPPPNTRISISWFNDTQGAREWVGLFQRFRHGLEAAKAEILDRPVTEGELQVGRLSIALVFRARHVVESADVIAELDAQLNHGAWRHEVSLLRVFGLMRQQGWLTLDEGGTYVVTPPQTPLEIPNEWLDVYC